MNAAFAVLEATLFLCYVLTFFAAGLSFIHPSVAFVSITIFILLTTVNFHQFINLFKLHRGAYAANVRRAMFFHHAVRPGHAD